MLVGQGASGCEGLARVKAWPSPRTQPQVKCSNTATVTVSALQTAAQGEVIAADKSQYLCKTSGSSRAEFFMISSISLCQRLFLAWKAAAFCSVLQSPAWDLIRFCLYARAVLAKNLSQREFKISSCMAKSLHAKNSPLQCQCQLT